MAGRFAGAGISKKSSESVIKKEELSNPNSCMSKALDGEMTFVLLARDSAAPFTIRAWCQERIRLGRNKPSDQQIVDALSCADEMEVQKRDGVKGR